MDDLDEILIIKIFYDNKNFEIKTNNDISLEEIKKKCAEEIKYNEKDIDKITLWYIDEENDKNLINDSIDLIKYSKEIEFSKYFINLNIEINNNNNKSNNNIDNKELKKNKNEEEKEKKVNPNPNNTNININKCEDEKNENIQKLKNEIKLLKEEIEYYKKRIKNIIKYYEDVVKKNKKKYEKDLNTTIQSINSTIGDLVKENLKCKENRDNINKNEIKDEGNQINNIKKNEIEEEANQINNLVQNEINEEENDKNNINNFAKSKTFMSKKNNKKEKIEDINDKKIAQAIKNVENKKKKKEKEKEKENLFNIEGETPIPNQKLKENGKEYNLKKLEFIKYCNNCEKLGKKVIFKCVLCDNYFLCDICYKTRNKFHEPHEYFEIRYPNEVIRQIQERLNENSKLNRSVNSFYTILNNIFFDKKGNLVKKELNKNEIKNLKQICKEMKSVNADPMEYYSEYKLTFINCQLEKLDEESTKLLSEKIKLFIINLEEANLTNT